jgi:hypothetical protein
MLYESMSQLFIIHAGEAPALPGLNKYWIDGILYKRVWDLKLLGAAAILVFFINLPFGYWRSSVRKFSAQWILAIHTPVPFVVACRLFLGLGWHLVTFPILIAAFIAGQFAGGKLRRCFNS